MYSADDDGRKCNAMGEDVIAPSPINFDLNAPGFS